MSVFLSPAVSVREIDLSTTIPAVSTSIGVIVLSQTYKGPEYEQTLVTNEDQLIARFGKPTDQSFRDVLSAMGFLKYGRSLYCTRIMPTDATFSAKRIESGYGYNTTDLDSGYTFTAQGSVGSEYDDGPYDYISLGTFDTTLFPERVGGNMAVNEPLWFMSASRGDWGNRIRVLVYDKALQDAIGFFNRDTETFDVPSGETLSPDASAAAVQMWEDFRDNPSFGSPGYDDSLGWPVISELDTPMDADHQFVVVVQAKDQGETQWDTKEFFVVSNKEDAFDDEGVSIYVETVINERSNYVRVALNPSLVSTTEDDKGPIGVGMTNTATLTGGKNGMYGRHDDTSPVDGLSAEAINAYNLYSNPEEIDVNLFIESDKPETVKRHLIQLAEVIRKDSFAIIDVPRNLVINNKGNEALDLVRWRKGQAGSTFNPNTSYAALYGNWIEVYDKWSKKYRWIPTSGFMAGLYAHTDNVADAWWAPAGPNRTILTGVRRLAWNPNMGERDALYQAGINPVVSFSGMGKMVLGQKTLLDKNSAFNRINVRRLFLVLQKAIATASFYFLFEQNDEVTWLLMTNMIEPFLREVQGRRGIQEFRVQIDETTNTPERIDRNELHGNIWIKPTRAVEFVRLNFVALPSGANIEELIDAGVVA